MSYQRQALTLEAVSLEIKAKKEQNRVTRESARSLLLKWMLRSLPAAELIVREPGEGFEGLCT